MEKYGPEKNSAFGRFLSSDDESWYVFFVSNQKHILRLILVS